MEKYVSFLRGINVGGHHKVPMAELRQLMEKKLGYTNVITILNSGNVIFEAEEVDAEKVELAISTQLEKTFKFPIPTIVRTVSSIMKLLESKPFEKVRRTKDTRCYISFLREATTVDVKIPWVSENNSYRIIGQRGKDIISVLDLAVSKTPEAMAALEKIYGKNITTRNMKTIERIKKKIADLEESEA